MRILLIDNDLKNRNNLSSRLRMQGYQIEAATGGFHALHLLEKKNYELILIYRDMEDMPGLEIASMTRSIDGYSDSPIIYFTKQFNEEAKNAMEMGASYCLSLKTDFKGLISIISKLFKKSSK